jgi:NADH-quinone oxidoreductase subunit N
MVGSDQGTLLAYLIILSAAGLGILLSPPYLKRLQLVHQGEYYVLLLLSSVGMMLMAAATNLLMIFLGIEMLSLALYILSGFIARRRTSLEAGMKYFLLSSFASAFLLYGLALTYGATGSTGFKEIASYASHLQGAANGTAHAPTLLLAAMALLAVGFAFKVSAIPFQAWTPDVYQGAPAPVTAFMSVGTKAAAMIAFGRLFGLVLLPFHDTWAPIVWAIAILTIVGGNVMAVVQTNAKRLLAYSSIAHAGYLLIGIVVGGTLGMSALLFYLACYTFLNLGAFGSISLLERLDNTGSDANDLRGLWYRRPIVAGLLAFFLLALAGFPPMAGFAGKYYIFYAALAGGHPELLIIGVLASVLGMYYYLRVIATMFMEQSAAEVAPALASIPNSPRPSVGRRSTRGSTTRAASGGSTAVAVKSETRAALATTPAKAEIASEEQDPARGLNWFSWTSLVIAVVGTLALGTALPFWLVQFVQQAAPMMLPR